MKLHGVPLGVGASQGFPGAWGWGMRATRGSGSNGVGTEMLEVDKLQC